MRGDGNIFNSSFSCCGDNDKVRRRYARRPKVPDQNRINWSNGSDSQVAKRKHGSDASRGEVT
jgi:hypothetical protein